MGDDAAEIEQRCEAAVSSRDGMKTAIATKARETKAEVTGFMKTYLEDAEALDGLEFLSMAEAGEMAHWEILAKLNEKANDADIGKLVTFAVRLSRKATSTRCASIHCSWPVRKILRGLANPIQWKAATG